MEKVNRNVCRNLLLAAACALFGFALSAQAQSAVEKALLAKAQSLAASGHLDMAAQTWQQVLLADPNNREALSGIAKADMQLGKTDEARMYLERLRAAGGNAADLAKIQGMPDVEPRNVRLSQAGSFAQNGRYADAMRIYRDVFGSTPPPGDYALAYYDTEAAIPEDRPHAVAGLRKLAQQFPADSRYSITLGRILTYDPKTRPEGIAILRRYDSVPAAQNALNQAEAWNAIASSTPASPVTSSAEKPAATTPAGNPMEASAYRALNSGRLDEAKRQFETLLEKQPNNPRALSGMGYVYMKQQDFTEASSYLERARAAGARGLDSAIATSHFWEKMSQAGDALQSGNTESAIESYNAALALKPSSPDALEGLGGAYAQAGNNSEAIDAFERAVRVGPERQGAWRGLFLAQSAAGESQAALATNDRMPKTVRAQLNNDPEYLRALAQANLALGRKAEADRTIQQSLALPFPNEGRDLPVDKQTQYAALLMMANRYEPALQLYQQIVTEEPENAGAWRALIAAQHQLGRDDEALGTVARIPQTVLVKEQSDPAFLVLVGSIYQTRHEWDRAQKYLEQALAVAPPPQIGIELQLADVYASQGNQQKAYTIFRKELDRNPQNADAWRGMVNALHQGNHDREALRQIAAMPESVRLRLEQDTSYLQTLASIQSAVGQNQAAMKTFAQLTQIYRDRNTDEPVDVQIQYGWVLMRAGDDQRLYALVGSLSNSVDMTDEQLAEFNRLFATWSVRRANSALAAGNQNRAVAILDAAAQAFPGNADVYSSLAGLYLKIGQPKQAVAIYASMDMTHATSQMYESAIGAAMAARDMRQAETWLESALDQYKNSAGILRLAA
ncbi:MAG TPA: tetratricopeptide repeat protein, partial [Alloacidobacterium sp.]|nr:tetratricopeptide repeat protein [Alloacidobacterium sp.]